MTTVEGKTHELALEWVTEDRMEGPSRHRKGFRLQLSLAHELLRDR